MGVSCLQKHNDHKRCEPNGNRRGIEELYVFSLLGVYNFGDQENRKHNEILADSCVKGYPAAKGEEDEPEIGGINQNDVRFIRFEQFFPIDEAKD